MYYDPSYSQSIHAMNRAVYGGGPASQPPPAVLLTPVPTTVPVYGPAYAYPTGGVPSIHHQNYVVATHQMVPPMHEYRPTPVTHPMVVPVAGSVPHMNYVLTTTPNPPLLAPMPLYGAPVGVPLPHTPVEGASKAGSAHEEPQHSASKDETDK
mmetsp:Transcript_4804/g.12937  ORF Transcript_4804/g.12937 Transcript_4804/m.12937 type:complete len:153 (-) Transcript_4804:1079-1537(-)